MSRPRLEPAYFEDLYRRDPDPWDFATSAYERDKYATTLAALGPRERRFARALEVGCSIGVFTALLAPRCDELLAVDAAPSAVARARERLAGERRVRVERRTFPEQLPAGPFDLIVCSEVLYYLDAPLLRGALAPLEAALAPGGSLIAVHWRGPTRTYPLQGDDVHELLLAHTSLTPAVSDVRERYRIDRLDRPPA